MTMTSVIYPRVMVEIIEFAVTIENSANPFRIDGRSREDNVEREKLTKSIAMEAIKDSLHEYCPMTLQITPSVLESTLRRILDLIPDKMTRDGVDKVNFFDLLRLKPTADGKSKDAMARRADEINQFNLNVKSYFESIHAGMGLHVSNV